MPSTLSVACLPSTVVTFMVPPCFTPSEAAVCSSTIAPSVPSCVSTASLPLIQSKLQTRSMALGSMPQTTGSDPFFAWTCWASRETAVSTPCTDCTLVAVSVGMVMKFLLAIT